MSNDTKNVFLNIVCSKLRKSRPMIPVGFDISSRVEQVDNLPFVNLWFRTQGCSHDRQGACTFCNYGSSKPVSAADMIGYLHKGFSSLDIDEDTILLVTPSGSMFDEREVPPEAFEAMLRLVGNTKCQTFLCETRAETLTESKVNQYVRALNDKAASVEIGLESANPWVLKYCLNKNLSLNDYRQAIQMLNKYRVGSSTTILLGGAFLSPRETIEDTTETVRWAFEQGTDRTCIFPAHVKKWTLLEWLWKRNLYSPPSLWSLIEVLLRLGPELSSRVYIAWYKVYDQHSEGIHLDPVQDLEYLSSPKTCVKCQPRVMKLLDMYRNYHTFSIVEELSQINCDCKDRWRATLETPEVLSLSERVISAYDIIGKQLFGADWWTKYGDSIVQDIRTSSIDKG